jgi:hypothetical protein
MATIRLPNDFKEFFELLNSENVDYLLVGGYAVIYYGYSRATGDIDVWVRVSAQNSAAICRALAAFGFSPASIDAQMFLERDKVFQIGVPPLRIDLLTSITGVEFDPCFQHSSVIDCDGTPIRIIGLADLRTNKQASGRSKDQADLEYLP